MRAGKTIKLNNVWIVSKQILWIKIYCISEPLKKIFGIKKKVFFFFILKLFYPWNSMSLDLRWSIDFYWISFVKVTVSLFLLHYSLFTSYFLSMLMLSWKYHISIFTSSFGSPCFARVTPLAALNSCFRKQFFNVLHKELVVFKSLFSNLQKNLQIQIIYPFGFKNLEIITTLIDRNFLSEKL